MIFDNLCVVIAKAIYFVTVSIIHLKLVKRFYVHGNVGCYVFYVITQAMILCVLQIRYKVVNRTK